MPSKDIYHAVVKKILIKDGWTITHDPFRLQWGSKDLYVDLGAERLLAAEKEQQKIAVEVKSFVGHSLVADLEQALGQYVLYHDIMERIDQTRILYLAIRKPIFEELFEEPIGKVLLENSRLKLVVFDAKTEEVVKWIP